MNAFFLNKVVVITGSTSGIGKEMALQILKSGGKVLINSRNEDQLERVLEEFALWKDQILIQQGDVGNAHFANQIIKVCIEKFGRIDILINNAGSSGYGQFELLVEEVPKEIISSNVFGSIYTTAAAIPELKKTKGTVVFISSIAGLYGIPGASIYSLSKMSLTALAQSVSIELKKDEVTTCIAYVGFTKNSESKRTLSPEGNWVSVKARPALLITDKSIMARKVLNQIRRRQFAKVYSRLGQLLYYLNRLSPRLVKFIFNSQYAYINDRFM